MRQESHRHHYVPEFLLKAWTIDSLVNGYWWNSKKDQLDCNRKGAKAFCFAKDLLTLRGREEERDALERRFFADIDTKGSIARRCLLENGPNSLNNDQRSDFVRLLLSFEARRPTIVRKLRDDGSRYLAESIDNDPKILRQMEIEGLSGTPSTFLTERGFSFEDRALSNVQKLANDPTIGHRLINMHWQIIRLGPNDGTFVLSDRPLVRLKAYDHPGAAWFLPLHPKSAFCAVNNSTNLNRTTSRRFAKLLNIESARQAQKYVFCAEERHKRWLVKYLCTNDR